MEKQQELLDIENEILFFIGKQSIHFNIPFEKIEIETKEKLKVNPNDPIQLMILGEIQMKFHNDFKNSLQTFKQVLQIDSQNIDCRLNIIYFTINRKELNIQVIQRLIEECMNLDSNYWRTYFTAGMFHNVNSHYHIALNIVKKGNELFPNNLWIQVLLAQLYAKDESTHKLSQYFINKALEFKIFNYEVLIGIGIVFYCLKNYNQSEKYFKQALKLNQNAVTAISYLAYIYNIRDKNIKKSLELSLKSNKLNPNNILSNYNLSQCYKTQKNYALCLIYMKECFQMTRDSFEIYYNLSRIYFSYLKNLDQSNYYATKTIQINPSSQKANYFYQFVQQSNQNSLSIKPDSEKLERSQIQFLNSYQQGNEEFLYNTYQEVSEDLNSTYND